MNKKLNFFVVLLILFTAILAGCDDVFGTDDVAVTGITLSKTTATMTVDGTLDLTARITPSDATDKTVTWSTSNSGIATITNGEITAVATGTATVTVTSIDGSKTATCNLTVETINIVIANTVLEDFEGDTPTIGEMGWNTGDVEASIKTNSNIVAETNSYVTTNNDTSTKSLQILNNAYNAIPTIQVTIPSGTSLSDYSSLKVSYFGLSGDASYKAVYLYASGDTLSGGAGYEASIGKSNLIAAITENNPMAGLGAWGEFTFDLTNTDGQTLITALDGTTTLNLGIGASTAAGALYLIDNIILLK